MEVDVTTYNDLSVFHSEEEFSIFHKLNFTKTEEGKDWLYRFFKNPFSDAKLIVETQNIVRRILENETEWPTSISNGTIMVITRFYESSIDIIPSSPNLMEAINYKVFHAPDFSLVRYSLIHFADFAPHDIPLFQNRMHEHDPAHAHAHTDKAKAKQHGAEIERQKKLGHVPLSASICQALYLQPLVRRFSSKRA